jgi:hypothetical protein
MEELWVSIKEFEGLYLISSKGRIKALPKSLNIFSGNKRITKEKILKNQIDHRGYESIILRKDKTYKSFKVHRLVGQYFVDNCNGYNEINHLDGNKLNNNFDNLEWCNRSINLLHAYKTGLRKLSDENKLKLALSNSRKVICTKTNIIYNSVLEAANSINMNKGTLSCKLLGKRRNETNLKFL